MNNTLPTVIADYLAGPEGLSALVADAIWFRWNLQARRVESSGATLRATPEQMSRPRTTVYVRVGEGPWKRYA
jgi:hypothetical protein